MSPPGERGNMAKKLWGGRFTKKTDPMVEDFTKSISYDYKLAEYDVIGSITHVCVLRKAKFITGPEGSQLIQALCNIYEQIKKDEFVFDKHDEDVHTSIQNAVQTQVGDLALKLHTARSRNDQVALATKLYLKFETIKLTTAIVELICSILTLINKNSHIIIPGFTHLQHAQPVLLGDYLSAYVNMLERDGLKLTDIRKHTKISMGAGALAGTPIDAAEYEVKLSEVLKEIKFHEVFDIEATSNSLDAVSDRDYVIEALSVLSMLGMHLSRLAEDLIIWSTKEFDFIEIDEAFCTGSSLMPQKKNPDVLELIRGYTGRLYGNLVSVLTMMKGLPLTYNRDMQLDKEPLFNSFDIVSKELEVLTGLIATLKFNEDNIKKQLEDESLYATDLVYYLVIEKGVAFKDAHTSIGKLIRYSVENEIKIKDMLQDQLDIFSDRLIKNEIVGLFNPQKSILSKKSVKKENLEKKLAQLNKQNKSEDR